MFIHYLLYYSLGHNVSQSDHHFSPDYNIATISVWLAVKFGAGLHSLTTNPTDFGGATMSLKFDVLRELSQ